MGRRNVITRSALAALLLAGPAVLMAAPPKTPMDLEARKAREKAEHGVKGDLWAAASGEFALCLDGRKVVQNETKLPRSVELKPGGVLAVRIRDKALGRGFAMIFVSENRRVVISSNTGEWFAYQPADPACWWEVRLPAGPLHAPATRAADQSFKGEIEGQAGDGCEAVWGDPAKPEAYLFKILSLDELIE